MRTDRLHGSRKGALFGVLSSTSACRWRVSDLRWPLIRDPKWVFDGRGKMALELSFKSIRDSLKKDWKDDPKFIDDLDSLSGLLLICAPLAVPASAVAILP